MENNKLKNYIYNLIQSKKESNYYDFKQEPYSKEQNHKFVHDIISLANSQYTGNRYLILGVTDYGEIVGVENIKDRKKLEGYISILRSCNFAGDIRPEISFESIEIDEHIIEVIIIEDKPLKPFYLIAKYVNKNKKTPMNNVNAYHIYTRNGDRNTPINESADLYHIEQMWLERFGINKTPFEKMQLLLEKPENWIEKIEHPEQIFYHKLFPEFTIVKSQEPLKVEEPLNEVFLGFNKEIPFYDLIIKYHSTHLYEISNGLTYCHDSHLATIFPDNSVIFDDNETNSHIIYYFLKDTLKYKLFKLFAYYFGTTSRGIELPIFFFDKQKDLDAFLKYLEKKLDKTTFFSLTTYSKRYSHLYDHYLIFLENN